VATTKDQRTHPRARGIAWRPIRSRTDRVIAGVAGGLAEQLGVDAVVIRLAFVVLALAGGMGVLTYAVLWLTATDAPPPGGDAGHSAARRERRSEPMQLACVALVVTGMLLILRQIGVWFGDGVVWPVAVAAFGSAVIWTRSEGPGRDRIANATSRFPRLALDGVRTGKAPALRLVLGSVLVLAGMVGLLVINDALITGRVIREVLFAVLVTASGIGLILGPWVFRLARQVSEERRNRIRSEERAELAAHLHDSVLQTLAMIQRSSSPQEMTALARGQERELRAWLYRRTRPVQANGSANGRPTDGEGVAGRPMLSVALDQAASKIEQLHHVSVETVVVGDTAVDDRLGAVVEAATEAMQNAARHSGAGSVAVYCEVGPDTVNLYVRDEGHGFDMSAVPDDRRGISESIFGRMERAGGVATVTTEPREGTEVHIRMPRPRGDA
jgi:signal transduction histidine kinase